MIQRLVIWLSCISVIVALNSLFWGWMVLLAGAACFIFIYYALKVWRWKYIGALSPEANKMLRKYGYFYHVDFDWEDLSDGCGKLARAVTFVMIIGFFHSFWWGALFGILYFLWLDHISNRFNHSKFLVQYEDVVHHDEILNYLEQKAEQEEQKRTDQAA